MALTSEPVATRNARGSSRQSIAQPWRASTWRHLVEGLDTSRTDACPWAAPKQHKPALRRAGACAFFAFLDL